MQIHGPFVKRKSFEKLQPEMPKRKISQNSRQGSKRKHRTQHKLINSPQIQLKAYKRKNLLILNQMQAGHHESEKKLTKQQKLEQLRTNRTKQSINLTQQSTLLESNQRRSVNKSNRNYSNSKNSPNFDINDKRINLINRQQMTSRFTIDHKQVQEDSLSNLIHQKKSKNSNPLINTARLKQDQGNKKVENIFGSLEVQKNRRQNDFNENIKDQMNKAIKYDIYQINQSSSGNIDKTSSQFHQKQSQQGQNFDDYEFAGQKSVNELKGGSNRQKKSKSKNHFQPPRVKNYGVNDIINIKPQNWRDLNRYIPRSQSQHRMDLQVIKNQKAALQSIRQQQQMIGLSQEYQLNKNSINLVSQRKIQTNKIIQNFYRERRTNSEKKNSNSLPLLKAFSQPKNIIIVPSTDKPHHQEMKSYNLGQADSIETLIKKIEQKSKIKSSLSFSKLGFGSSNPRNLNHEDICESQLQNVRNIQKKLRQKGVQFNTDSIRKGFLNFRDGTVSKISKTGLFSTQSKELNNQNMLELPEKQLPSNGFYKIFPL